MSIVEALILGIVQGLTEFLPVSSSGHIELGKRVILENPEEDLTFTLVVHGATVLSTLVVFRKDIWAILKDLLAFEWNENTVFSFKLALSCIPVGIVGLFFKEKVEALFDGNLVLVGSCLLVTSGLLFFAWKRSSGTKQPSWLDAFVIGISQAIAVLPGISRSGATISTALLLGVKRETATRFSFLMVLIPIIGANLKELMDSDAQMTGAAGPLIVGFIAAFASGWFACKAMIGIVNQGRLSWFAIYCFLVGLTALIVGWIS